MSKLTKRDVTAATPPKRKAGEPEADYRKRSSWVPDGEVGGFGVRVYGGGRKVFCLRYRNRGGRSRMLRLGTFGELTVEKARDMAREHKVKILQGEDPQAERQRQASTMGTVSELMDQWLESYAKAHRKRWKGDENRIKARIKPKLGRLALGDLTPDVLATWHRKIGTEAKVEANRCLETLRAAWRWADGEGLLPEGLSDKTSKVKRFKETDRDRWLRAEEVTRLMKEVRKETDPYARAAIPLLLLTGLRKQELLQAKWADVDMERGELHLPDSKTGGPQTRLLPGPAVALLRELPRMQGSPYVFPSPTDPREPRRDLKRQWNRLRAAANLADITLHDLRRTAGSFMAQAGVPLQVIQEVLGQSHPGVTRIYARLASENERAALETLADALSGPLGLDTGRKKAQALPDMVRDLLKDVGDDPEALAVRLQELLPGGRPVKA